MNIFSSIKFIQPTEHIKIIGKEIVILPIDITCEEDFSDTVNCISTIKKVFSKSKLVIMELNSKYKEQLEQLCDYYISYSSEEENKLFKINVLIYFFTHFLDDSTDIIHIIPEKTLHQDFNRENIIQNKFNFFPYGNYSIPKQIFPHMLSILEQTKIYILSTGSTLEQSFLLLPESLVNKI